MQTFHITVDGPDSDFGTNSEHIIVTFKESFIWDDDMIRETKEFLAEFYDVTPSRVLTDEEEKKDAESLEKYINEHLNHQPPVTG